MNIHIFKTPLIIRKFNYNKKVFIAGTDNTLSLKRVLKNFSLKVQH